VAKAQKPPKTPAPGPAPPAAAGKPAAAAKPGRKKEFRKKREKKHVPAGLVYIRATFNNTQVTVTDLNGNTVASTSSGSVGFKGSRKGTPFAAGQAAAAAAARAREVGMRTVEVRVKGPGGGRESAVRALGTAGLQVTTIRDVTPIPHNGCRPPKRRRV
jgi:small subunit ribosomal protein S11